jgi:hypothetical protein
VFLRFNFCIPETDRASIQEVERLASRASCASLEKHFLNS